MLKIRLYKTVYKTVAYNLIFFEKIDSSRYLWETTQML